MGNVQSFCAATLNCGNSIIYLIGLLWVAKWIVKRTFFALAHEMLKSPEPGRENILYYSHDRIEINTMTQRERRQREIMQSNALIQAQAKLEKLESDKKLLYTACHLLLAEYNRNRNDWNRFQADLEDVQTQVRGVIALLETDKEDHDLDTDSGMSKAE